MPFPSFSVKKRFLVRPRLSLRARVVLLAGALLLAAGAALTAVGYRQAASAALESVNDRAAGVTGAVLRDVLYAVRPVLPYLRALAQGPLPASRSLPERLAMLPVLWPILEQNPVLEGLWIGYEDGDFLLVDILTTDAERRAIQAPPGTSFLVWSIERDGQTTAADEGLFFDAALKPLGRRKLTDRRYDPRQRAWYQQAIRRPAQVSGGIQTFTLPQIAITIFMEKSDDGQAVVGARFSAGYLSSVLRRERPSPDSQLALIEPDGFLIATDQAAEPISMRLSKGGRAAEASEVIALGLKAYQEGRRGRITVADAAGREWVLALDGADPADQVYEATLLALPEDELLWPARRIVRRGALTTGGLLVLVLPLVYLATRRFSRSLESFADVLRHLPAHYLDQPAHRHSTVTEVRNLALGLTAVRKKTQRIFRILAAANAESDSAHLLDILARETTTLADADGGLAALWDQEQGCFTGGAGCWWGKAVEVKADFRADCRRPDPEQPLHQAIRRNKTVFSNIPREDRRGLAGYLSPGFDDPATARVDVVCVPLKNRAGASIGALALFRAVKTGTETFQTQEVIFIQSLASAAAVALENRNFSGPSAEEKPDRDTG